MDQQATRTHANGADTTTADDAPRLKSTDSRPENVRGKPAAGPAGATAAAERVLPAEEIESLGQGDLAALRFEIKRQNQADVTRRASAQARLALKTTRVMAEQLDEIKTENLQAELEILRQAVKTAPPAADSPFEEVWQERLRLREAIERIEQELAARATASRQQLASSAQLLANIEADLKSHHQRSRENQQAFNLVFVLLAGLALAVALISLQTSRAAALNPDLRLRLARVALDAKQPELALSTLDELAAAEVQAPELVLQMADSYYQLKEYAQAIDLLPRVIARQPANEAARLTLARSYAGAKQPAEAVAAYRRLLALNPVNATYYYELGRQYEALPNSREAIAAYERVLDIDSRHAGAYLRLGEIYRQQGQYDHAIVNYEQVLALNPAHYWANLNIGQSYAALDQPVLALDYYQQAAQIDPDQQWAYYYQGQVYQAQHQWAAAARAYRQAIERKPDWAEAQLGLAQSYLAQGNCTLAMPSLLEAARLQPSNEEALAGLAYCGQ